jgi:enoyl-CoA hydratase/carnithine racemase
MTAPRSTATFDPGTVTVTREGAIATVALDRPDKLNALTRRMWRELGAAVDALGAAADLRCIVVRGAGERAFSPGNDIGEFERERSNSGQAREYGAVMHAALRSLDACPLPIVAEIHGICVGGGLEIAALCDLRICGEGSRFGAPIRNLGLVMAHAEMAPLLRLAGYAATLEILLEGRIFDAAEALRKGLVTRVVADADVAAEALATAQRIAGGAPRVARWHKKFARRLRDATPLTDDEVDEAFDCFDTADFREGCAAFLARRVPRFDGR